MIGLDQLKYWLGLVNISLDWYRLGSVNGLFQKKSQQGS